MNLLKKYWSITLIILAIGIHLLVTNPLQRKNDLIFYFRIDLMYKHDGSIKEIDQNKYCALLEEISKNKSTSCEDNLNYWRQEDANDRIKINKDLKPENKLDEAKKALVEKIRISEWSSWGLIFVFIVVSFYRQRK